MDLEVQDRKCINCGSRVRVDPKYGNLDNCKFLICSYRPNLKMSLKTLKPNWCPGHNFTYELDRGIIIND